MLPLPQPHKHFPAEMKQKVKLINGKRATIPRLKQLTLEDTSLSLAWYVMLEKFTHETLATRIFSELLPGWENSSQFRKSLKKKKSWFSNIFNELSW